jgi:hypothetical protein
LHNFRELHETNQKHKISLGMAGRLYQGKPDMQIVDVSRNHAMHVMKTSRKMSLNWATNQNTRFWPKNEQPGNPEGRHPWQTRLRGKPGDQKEPTNVLGHLAEILLNLFEFYFASIIHA